MAAPVPQVMDAETSDVEVAAPSQVMMDEPQHGAMYAYNSLGDGAMPATGDSIYSKLCCVTASIGDLAGQVMIGEETKFFCIESQAFCGFGGNGGCPQANGGCQMFKPEMACQGAAKCLCIKFGFQLPEKPWIVCCGKRLLEG
ncbi:unnamed protein product [Effrenium voratum]|uniref:Uncharacterized protein n=1 Tax=Effrenium voratum TaxID=2562239 RepID=A0AA36ISG6_9DINO|nr:unnamed protein product [Effrenium voratum]CAJ1448560.1 unnamed protein product [Effrenium voratum]|eukprot:CAMPEP_0181455122 /NCGR_PEP_ID=MMETSP1110-20121109/30594_1 /TAXON_ID=174948 /ORGANISM="Symbiodinium sp., Strain CCMP421" /LENGTH=142 /DNA_ID=CAMNT_0023579495 /DNA_START=53 /DNA_END=481 /DNA_ORIENTATION=-